MFTYILVIEKFKNTKVPNVLTKQEANKIIKILEIALEDIYIISDAIADSKELNKQELNTQELNNRFYQIEDKIFNFLDYVENDL